jgi:hypothetical protein
MSGISEKAKTDTESIRGSLVAVKPTTVQVTN